MTISRGTRIRYSRGDNLAATLTAVLIGLGVLVMIAPIAITVVLSFSETFAFPPTGLTLKWYANFLGRRDFTDGLALSVALAVFTGLVATAVGTAAAVTLASTRFKGRSAVHGLLLSPISVPRVGVGIAIFLLFVGIGVKSAPLRLAVVHVLLAIPYVIVVVYASVQAVDKRLVQAAMNLGATPWEAFRRVTLPLIRPGVVAGALFAFIVSFDEVTASVFLIDARTETFPVVLFSYLAKGTTDPTIAAASSFMLIVVLVLVAIISKSVGLSRALGVFRPS